MKILSDDQQNNPTFVFNCRVLLWAIRLSKKSIRKTYVVHFRMTYDIHPAVRGINYT